MTGEIRTGICKFFPFFFHTIEREFTEVFMLICRTVFFGQFKCSGPGADHGERVKWSRELTEQEAKPFISLSFIDGHEWLLHI